MAKFVGIIKDKLKKEVDNDINNPFKFILMPINYRFYFCFMEFYICPSKCQFVYAYHDI